MTDAERGFLRSKRYLSMDRGTKFSAEFWGMFEAAGVKPLRLLPRSPNLVAHIARFMRSLKTECLKGMIFFGEDSLQTAPVTYMDYLLKERNHQGINNRLLIPGKKVGEKTSAVMYREWLGGLLRYYCGKAA